MRAVFIINPYSAKRHYQNIVKAIKKHNAQASILVSQSEEDTHSFIQKNINQADIFVAIGGDGTVSTVARALINTEKILAVYPAGSGNGFARELHFTKNLSLLLQKIKTGNYRTIDSFTINGNLAVNMAGVGFDGDVIANFEHSSRGFFNYIKICLKTFANYRPIKVDFETPWQRYNGEYLMLSVANTRQFGNNAYIAPRAGYADGRVEVILVKKFPLWYGAIFAYKMFAKKLKNNRYLTYLSVEDINFSVANSKAWHLDGEGYELSSPISIKVQPQSLRILSL